MYNEKIYNLIKIAVLKKISFVPFTTSEARVGT